MLLDIIACTACFLCAWYNFVLMALNLDASDGVDKKDLYAIAGGFLASIFAVVGSILALEIFLTF